MNEQECIDTILHGNTDVYRQLVERYQTGLIIHCENMLKDRAEGEDAAQEAFVRAYNHLNSFLDQKAQFSTWLYRIATNICIDQLRKNRRKLRVEAIDEIESVQPTYIQQAEIDAIRQAVEELEPPRYAEIIKAYFWEGKSYKQIANTYNTSTNTVGTWMRRAKLQLKVKLS